MNRTLPVSPTRLASLLRLTGMPRAIALVLAVVILGLTTILMNQGGGPISEANAAPSPTSTYTLTGKVVQVSDGDTINLLIDRETHRIRLASIDAPETAHGSSRPGQPFGEA